MNSTEDKREKVEKNNIIDFKRPEKVTEQSPQNIFTPKPPPFFNFGKIPIFTKTMVGLFIIIYLAYTFALTPGQKLYVLYTYGFVPAAYLNMFSEFGWPLVTGLFLHPFLHGGFMHLGFNTVMMLAMGLFMERRFGTREAALCFLVSILASVFFYFLLQMGSTAPMIGASGGISGLFGATLKILHHENSKRLPFPSRFLPMAGFWILLMLVTGFLAGSNIAWAAHIGGFLGGIGFIYLRNTQKKI